MRDSDCFLRGCGRPAAVCLLLALVLPAPALRAQVFYARLTGTITDTSKAVIPGAAVTVTHVGTNITRTATSDQSGVYSVPALQPGVYTLKVEAPGMQAATRTDLRLETNQVATLDVELSVASVAATVDVQAEVPLVPSETSSYGSVLESNLIREVPLLERDVMGLVNLFPGVISSSFLGSARSSRNVFESTFSVAGGRSSTNEVLLDGAPNTIGDFNGVAYIPPVDAVQEFRIETSSYSAEFGRSGGGVVNMVTKQGTNEYHGSLYDYLQNTALNANSFSNNRAAALPANAGKPLPKSIVKRNQFGLSLGGPIRLPKLYNGREKTFFFFSFEGRRERNPSQGLFTVPTELELRGDFSQTFRIVSGQPRLVQIYDPFTSRLQPNGRYFRDPLPDNRIPAARQNAIAQKVLSYFPAPNRPGNPFTNQSNYYFEDVQSYSRDLISPRVDHVFSQKHRLFGRFSWQENFEKNPGKIVRFASPGSILDNFRNYALDDTYTISNSALNNFRYSYTRFRANQTTATLGFDPTQLGLPSYFRDAANILYFPNFSFGYVDVGGPAYNNQPRDTQGFQNQVVWTKGKHTLRPGFEYRLYRFYPFQVFDATGSFSFGQSFTQQDHLATSTTTQGLGLASFLFGAGAFSFEHVDPLTVYHHYYAAYIQDDWKLTSRLTLNIGLRWDMETGTAETHGRLTYFDPKAASPVSQVTLPDGRHPLGALQFTTDDRPGSIREPSRRNFAPRIGFAYRLSDKMSVRGGYGVFYTPVGLESGIVTTPFNYRLAAAVTNPDYTPRVTLSNPFPEGIQPPATIQPVNDGSYRLGTPVNIVLRDEPAPYMQEWNFGISRQLSRTMAIDATYYGSRGVHLPIPTLEINQIDPKLLAAGSAYLTERVPNPFYGMPGISGGLLAQPTVPRMQLLKPFPQFAGSSVADAFGPSLTYYRAPVGDSIYHAASLKLDKRFSHGLSVQAHYTISKLIDIGGVGNGAAFTDPSGVRDIYNIRLERSISAWDVPQRLIVNYNLDLPFGRGKWLLGSAPGWVNQLVGGWSLHSIHTWQSGRPVNVGGTDQSRIAGATPSRVDVVSGVDPRYDLSTSRRNARDYDPVCQCTKPWFNPAAFAAPKPSTIPNGPRFLSTVRQDNISNWDFSLRKNFRVTERVGVQASGEFFNFLNQVQFAPNSLSVNSNTFGSAGPSNSPRRVQLGLKVNF